MSEDSARLEILKSIFKQPKVIVEYYHGENGEINTYTRTDNYIPIFISVMSDRGSGNGDNESFQLIKDFSLETIEAGVREWAIRVLNMTVKDIVVFFGMGSTKY